MYIQMDFILRKLAAQAESDPALRARQPWQAAWERDFAWFGDAMIASTTWETTAPCTWCWAEFLRCPMDRPWSRSRPMLRAFVNHARHPTLGLAYRDCVYQPMLELLRYLEANGFINCIVSGGGRDFMRGFAHELYGVPRERVIGSTVAYRYVEDEQRRRHRAAS